MEGYKRPSKWDEAPFSYVTATRALAAVRDCTAIATDVDHYAIADHDADVE